MILIKNGNVIDGISDKPKKLDILIDGEKIVDISEKIDLKSAITIDASGLYVAPSLFDIHTHLRIGNGDAEDFLSFTKAAIKGGVGSVVIMPNTKPPLDRYDILKKVIDESKKYPLNFFFTSTITEKREGKKINDFKSVVDLVVGFSDDGNWVSDESIMKEALEKARFYGKKIFSHSQVQGDFKDPKTEYLAVERDIELAKNSAIHFQHITLKKSLELIKKEKKINPYITCETCPHYFWFTSDDEKNDPDFKMNPPLRSKIDRDFIIEAIDNDIIDVIATDHAPHTDKSKSVGFDKAPYGVIGLETLLSSTITKLVIERKMNISKVIKKMSSLCASICQIKDRGSITKNYYADIIIFDINKKWKVEKNGFFSKSSNSPFKGKELNGVVLKTIINGKIVYDDGRFFI